MIVVSHRSSRVTALTGRVGLGRVGKELKFMVWLGSQIYHTCMPLVPILKNSVQTGPVYFEKIGFKAVIEKER